MATWVMKISKGGSDWFDLFLRQFHQVQSFLIGNINKLWAWNYPWNPATWLWAMIDLDGNMGNENFKRRDWEIWFLFKTISCTIISYGQHPQIVGMKFMDMVWRAKILPTLLCMIDTEARRLKSKEGVSWLWMVGKFLENDENRFLNIS